MTNSISEAMIEAGKKEAAFPIGAAELSSIYLAMSRASQPVDTGVEAYAREASIALAACAGMVGSEAFKRIGDESYADPDFCRRRSDERMEARTRIAARLTPPLDSEAVERLSRDLRMAEAQSAVTGDSVSIEISLPDLRALLSLAKPVGGER